MKRVITYPVHHRTGPDTFKAEVKGDGVRVVVGSTYPSTAEAVAAGREYIRTGVKPPAAKRGRKPKPASEKRVRARAKPRPRIERPVAAPPSRNPGRLELLRKLAQAYA